MSASHYYQPPFENVPSVPPAEPFDKVIPVIPTYDSQTHSVERPFCSIDSTCGCHEDPTLIAKVNEYVQEGWLTKEEATRTIKGEQI